jgi:hypothetical protein
MKLSAAWRSLILTWLCALPGVASAAVYDFNKDGTTDILFRNTSTGQLDIWLMNGTARSASGAPGTPTASWVIQGRRGFRRGRQGRHPLSR